MPRLALPGILGLGLALRLWGIDWGIPSSSHFFSFHPDEIDIVGHAAAIDFGQLQFNPQFFNYGTLPIYLIHLGGMITGLEPAKATPGSDNWATLHLVARCITVLLAAGTVFTTYRLGALLFARGAWETSGKTDAKALQIGLLAAALLAVLPGHVVHSHYATVDVPATFFVTACAMFAARMLHSNQPRWMILASICAGLAAATKYNAALAILFVFTARWLADWKQSAQPQAVPPRLPIALPLILVPFALAFLFACPFALIDFQTFWKDFSYELRHVRTGSGLIFEGVGPGWWNHLNTNLPFAMTTPGLVCAALGIGYGVARRERYAMFLLAFAAPYFLTIGMAVVSFLRYIIPLLPFLCIAAAWFCVEVLSSYLKKPAVIALGLIAFLASIQALCPFSKTDARILSTRWLRLRMRPGDRIGLLTHPWFWSPVLTPLNGGLRMTMMFRQPPDERLVILEAGGQPWDAAALQNEKPKWFAISEFEERDELRLGQEQAVSFFETLNHFYRLERKFKVKPPFTLPGRTLWVPHDWLYPNPEIRVYRLKNAD